VADRKGFALVAAILGVVLIGALVGGVLFAVTEETRAGAAGVDREIVLNACETAIALAITDPGVNLPDSIGVEGTISRRAEGPGPEILVSITRLDSALYMILAESAPESDGSRGTNRVGVVVRAAIADDRSITIVPISERAWFEVF
jgi:hypothetical protein